MNKLKCFFVDGFEGMPNSLSVDNANILFDGEIILPFNFSIIKYQEEINCSIKINQTNNNFQNPLRPKLNKLCFIFLEGVVDVNNVDEAKYIENEQVDFWPKNLMEVFGASLNNSPKKSLCLFYGSLKKVEDLKDGLFNISIDNYFNILNQIRFNEIYFLNELLDENNPNLIKSEKILERLTPLLNNFNFLTKEPTLNLAKQKIELIYEPNFHNLENIFPDKIEKIYEGNETKVKVIIDNLFDWLINSNSLLDYSINFLPFGFFKFSNQFNRNLTRFYADLWNTNIFLNVKSEIENNNNNRTIGKIEEPEKITLQELKQYDINPSLTIFENYKRDGGLFFNDGEEFSFLPGVGRAPNPNNNFGGEGGFEDGTASKFLKFLNLTDNVFDSSVNVKGIFLERINYSLTINQLPNNWKTTTPTKNLIDINTKQIYNRNSYGVNQKNRKGLVEYTNYEPNKQITQRQINELPFYYLIDADDTNSINEIWGNTTVYNFEIDLNNIANWESQQPILIIQQHPVKKGWRPIILKQSFTVSTFETNTGDILTPPFSTTETKFPAENEWDRLTFYEVGEKWFSIKNNDANFLYFTRGSFIFDYETYFYGERIYYKVENNKIKFQIRPWITTHAMDKNSGVRTFDIREMTSDNILYNFKVSTLHSNNELVKKLNKVDAISNVNKNFASEIFFNESEAIKFMRQLQNCWEEVWIDLYQKQNNTNTKQILIPLPNSRSFVELEFNSYVNNYQNHFNFASHWFLGGYDFKIKSLGNLIGSIQIFYLLDSGKEVFNWLITNKKNEIKTPIVLIDDNNQRQLFTNQIKLLKNSAEIEALKNNSEPYQIGFFEEGLYSNSLPTNQKFIQMNTIFLMKTIQGIFNWELISYNNSNYYSIKTKEQSFKLLEKYNQPIKTIEKLASLKNMCEFFYLFYLSDNWITADNFLVSDLVFDNQELVRVRATNRIDVENDSLEPKNIFNIIHDFKDEFDNLQNIPFVYFTPSFELDFKCVDFDEPNPFENEDKNSKGIELIYSPNFLAHDNFYNHWVFNWPYFSNTELNKFDLWKDGNKLAWDLYFYEELIEFLDYNNDELIHKINQPQNLTNPKTNLGRGLILWTQIKSVKIVSLIGII